MTEDLSYINTSNLFTDTIAIIESAKRAAYRSVNVVLVQRNWLLGKRIAEEQLGDQTREELYGQNIVTNLAKQLTAQYGSGFDRTNLYWYVRFYQCFPNIVDTACKQSLQLTWSHYRTLLQVEDEVARQWYETEAIKEVWSVKTLQRNISSQYYYRILQSAHPQRVADEMHKLTAPMQDKDEFIKNPVVVEFLGLSPNTDYTESTLEKAIITNLQKFLMELGKGYAFVARQQHIRTEKEEYYIDLVFYNYLLKCFVLIDLKTSKVTHQDVGQMDMYVRMYDELKKGQDDNPTIGILLCADTDEDIARFSILKGNEQLYATKYQLYLPTKEELRREIETQKALFALQHQS
jgi:predicted nuclease of restriction endonuclease-like (RecB) superfamily